MSFSALNRRGDWTLLRLVRGMSDADLCGEVLDHVGHKDAGHAVQRGACFWLYFGRRRGNGMHFLLSGPIVYERVFHKAGMASPLATGSTMLIGIFGTSYGIALERHQVKQGAPLGIGLKLFGGAGDEADTLVGGADDEVSLGWADRIIWSGLAAMTASRVVTATTRLWAKPDRIRFTAAAEVTTCGGRRCRFTVWRCRR